MINLPINEFTVYADKLEDEGIDVSLLRLLCIYNSPSLSNSYGSIEFFVPMIRVRFGNDENIHGNGGGYGNNDVSSYIDNYGNDLNHIGNGEGDASCASFGYY